MARKQPPAVDICLLLEGTYPYVSGGVSTWVHQIIAAYPAWKFGIFFLGGQKDPKAAYKYQVPPNVAVIEELYLFDPADFKPSALHRAVPSSWTTFYTSLRKLFVRLPDGSGGDLDIITPLLEHIMQQRGVSFEDFYHSPQTWSVLRELYDRYAPDESFIHFFWTCRYLIEPLWKLARALPRVPKAKVYHCACTGYAGFLGALISHQTDTPLLLSEHGIYLKERIQDICRSPWIPEFPKLRPTLTEPLGSLRRLWIGFFDVLGRLCYEESAHMVSLFAKNAGVQQHFGADAEKISIVPNGISTEACDEIHHQRARRQREDSQSRVVGFLGRVVSIKDVKTLLRAARLVCDVLPDAQFLIAGPTDEEPEYHRDCMELTQQLQLNNNVQFLGLQKRDDVLPLMDVMVLTSISEGLPFVVLEAMAAGIPLVSTDVGACRELLEGRPSENPPLGPCGIVTEIGNTDEIARALVRLLSYRDLQQLMSEAGRRRAMHHYHERDTLDDYRQIYEQLMALGGAIPTRTIVKPPQPSPVPSAPVAAPRLRPTPQRPTPVANPAPAAPPVAAHIPAAFPIVPPAPAAPPAPRPVSAPPVAVAIEPMPAEASMVQEPAPVEESTPVEPPQEEPAPPPALDEAAPIEPMPAAPEALEPVPAEPTAPPIEPAPLNQPEPAPAALPQLNPPVPDIPQFNPPAPDLPQFNPPG